MKNEKIYRKNKALLKIADSLFIDTDAKIFLKAGCLFFDISSYEKTPVIIHNTDRLKALEKIVFSFNSGKSEVINANEKLEFSPSKIENEDLIVTDGHKIDALKNNEESISISESELVAINLIKNEFIAVSEHESFDIYKVINERAIISENVTILLVQLNGPINGSQINGAII